MVQELLLWNTSSSSSEFDSGSFGLDGSPKRDFHGFPFSCVKSGIEALPVKAGFIAAP